MRPVNTIAAGLLVLLMAQHPATAAPVAEDRHGLPQLSVHDFAAKYLMQQADLADLHVYEQANAALKSGTDRRPRIVMIGDSITFHWKPDERPFPQTVNVLNRGVPGQNTDQMLLRFEDDVVALDPVAVVIAGGANDARVYAGPPEAARSAVLARITRNVTAMADIAQSHHIRVIIAAITPCKSCAALDRDPETIKAANAWLRSFAASRHDAYADYFSALANAEGTLPADLTLDGLHLTPSGYARMWPQLRQAVKPETLPR
ncbi:MAG: GDSL-type esterase/lipase family protein [Gluconobacter potus]|uniref:GDSL family lipase n=1 Tax=Gluconobacter potus TaxID=2724927 RepID=A0ABR9YJK6_9PROT|nr:MULTISPECIES: GDSL-type esterase/lipase family protein [Gluconobacter]MBF0863413.1 GDSL family lipase [Gluconobacter sp. R71656]MBF0866220.1 GDSL family lipase [Gluconobacter sp. R75628]MBF0872652.1 GDSL family lipase [Gluconobacter sp. R75629]MBF0881618.1 GDSL family lipase [Gluconobacter potus]